MLGIEWLLEHGADPNVTSGDGEDTPLHAICVRGWGAETVRMFLAHGANPNARRSNGQTPYVLAAATGNLEAMDELARAGADRSLSPAEATMAEWARGQVRQVETFSEEAGRMFVKLAELGNLAGVQAMLQSGIDPAVIGESGATALHFACFSGWMEIASALIDAGAPIEPRDSDYSATPLGWALYGLAHNRNPKGDYAKVLRVLLAAGANRNEILGWIDEGEGADELLEALK